MKVKELIKQLEQFDPKLPVYITIADEDARELIDVDEGIYEQEVDDGYNVDCYKWDLYFMRFAFSAAQNSTCLRHSGGAIICKDKRIISTGYNGSPRNAPNCVDLEYCLKDKKGLKSGEYGSSHECHAVHAEENAVIQAGLKEAQDGTIYSTMQPCYHCAKSIVNSGIKEVVYCLPYPDNKTIELFKQCNIIIRQFIPTDMGLKIFGRNKEELQILKQIKGIEPWVY